jgi:hypothetical protein
MIRLLAVIEFLVQITFAIHAMRTGKELRWVIIILSFPVVGCLLYYFLEVFPGSREHRQAYKAVRRLARKMQPDAELKKRVQNLEACGSVDNRIALAEECMAHKMYDDAVRLYESCLEGLYARDGKILFGVAMALVESGNVEKSAAAIARVKADAPKVRPNEVALLEARLLELRGDTDRCIEAYRALLPQYVGLEARFRFGTLLAKMGQQTAAITVFEEIVKQAKKNPPTNEDEEFWLAGAKKALTHA